MSGERREAAALVGTVDLAAVDSVSARHESKGGLPPSGAVLYSGEPQLEVSDDVVDGLESDGQTDQAG